MTFFFLNTRTALATMGAAAALLALPGCAPLNAGPSTYAAGRAKVDLPPGAWVDLGATEQALPLLPDNQRITLQTRAMGLRGSNARSDDFMAVVLVQTNRENFPRERFTLWPGGCAPQRGVIVEDAADGSPVRLDCLRLKRTGNSRDWLDINHPEIKGWMAANKITLPAVYSHVHYRYTADNGALVVVNALVDQRLLRPETRNNEQFLRAGQPALQWSRQLGKAARESTGMLDGYLPVPPFPYSIEK